jgi:hypothetical protein
MGIEQKDNRQSVATSLWRSLLWIEDKMKKMKLSLASIIVDQECYKRKHKNVSKVLNLMKFL